MVCVLLVCSHFLFPFLLCLVQFETPFSFFLVILCFPFDVFCYGCCFHLILMSLGMVKRKRIREIDIGACCFDQFLGE